MFALSSPCNQALDTSKSLLQADLMNLVDNISPHQSMQRLLHGR